MVPILTTVLDDWSQGPVLTIEESKMDVDGFILLNQPQAMVLLACDQDEGKRQGAYTQEDRPNMADGSESQRIQSGR